MGAKAQLGPPAAWLLSSNGSALDAQGWHDTVAPAVHCNALQEALEEGPALTGTPSYLPLCTLGRLGAAWHRCGAVPPPADMATGGALPPLESEEGETSALSNLPSRSRSHPPLLYIPDTILVKALGETPACILPASPDPRQRAGPPERRAALGSALARPALAKSEVGVDSLMIITSQKGSNSS